MAPSEAFGKPLSELSPQDQRQILTETRDSPIEYVERLPFKP
jgi:hypothetical protein